ncbi:MAG: 2-hydroxyacyl-CoA dehydratase family protein [Chloroflexota bacterium]|nr:2-hydroxyacyl-CoA dehydratase family protein [Chloroflexota bacterium]
MPKYPRLRSLKEINSVMARYYVQRKALARLKPLAYVTSGAPVEILEAMGILTLYPENYGALCGAHGAAVGLCQVAEAQGFPADLCSYARGHIGAVLQPRDAPLSGMPRPDLLVCCNNICGTVLKWYETLAVLYDVPLFVLDVPFQRATPLEPHIVAYVADQLSEFVAWLEAHTGRRLKPAKFRSAMALSRDAVALWQEILEFGQHHPSPINAPDLFVAMAPIVALRGTRRAVDCYRHLKAELEERVSQGIGAVPSEQYRLLWDNIAIWYRLYRFFRPFMDAGACFVADTYTNAWTVELDLENPFPGLARAYTGVFINVHLPARLRTIADLARHFQVDGMVMHANRSCKPFSITQSDVRDELRDALGLPILILEADMCDARLYNEGAVRERVAAFLEML